MEPLRILVLGAGSWGTALAEHLARAGNDVTLWGRDPEVLVGISKTNKNQKYLGDLVLSDSIQVEPDIVKAVDARSIVVVAVPSDAVRRLLNQLADHIPQSALVVSATKGLEDKTLLRMSEVIRDELGDRVRVAVLSGPSFAVEMVERKPTAVTVAGEDSETADRASEIFHFDNLRTYSSSDLVGVEIGGAVKNVIAIACGAVDGVAVGANARAALVTRGLAEIQRLVLALGGDPVTVTGLSGLGDLLLTATGSLSRNRTVGYQLAQGEKLEQILQKLGQVAEGVKTTPKVLQLAERCSVEVPIAEEVSKLLNGQHSIEECISSLLARKRRAE